VTGAAAADPMCAVAALLSELVVQTQAESIPEGLTNAAAARFVGCSVSLWNSLNTRGLCPAPVQLADRRPVWPRTELKAWLLAGAPTRLQWRAIRDAAIRRAG
jgi:hypothetical protein